MNWIIGILSAIFIFLIVGSLIFSGKKFSLSFPKVKTPSFGKTAKKIVFWAIVIAVLFRLGIPQSTWKWFLKQTDSKFSEEIKLSMKDRELNEIRSWANDHVAPKAFDQDGNIDKDVLVSLDSKKDKDILELNKRLEVWQKKYRTDNWKERELATKNIPKSEFFLEATPSQDKMAKTYEQPGFMLRKITSMERSDRLLKITFIDGNGKPSTVGLNLGSDGYYKGFIPNIHKNRKDKEKPLHLAPYRTPKKESGTDAISGQKYILDYIFEGNIDGNISVHVYKKTYEANAS